MTTRNTLMQVKADRWPHRRSRFSAGLVLLLLVAGCRSPLVEAPPPQGTWKSLGKTAGSLYAFDFVSPTDGWAVAQLGELTLLKQNKPKPEEVGWVVYETHDGGQTFTKREKKVKPPIRFLRFADQTHGWALDEENSILRTTDGGQTWPVQRRAGLVEYKDVRYKDAPMQKIKEPLDNIVVVDPLTAFAYGGGYRSDGIEQGGVLLTTSDGGKTWRNLNFFFAQRLQTMFFRDAQHGWAYDAAGTLYRTTDGGQTWVVMQPGTGSGAILGLFFVTPEVGWMVGKGGDIRHTKDGGKTWQKQSPPVKSTLQTVFFLDQDRGWAAGADGVVLATTDGGRRWHKQESDTDDAIAFLHVEDPQTAWAASQNGTILKYQPPS